MTSEDDPEARIRELEQPLAETARASEAAANQSASKWAPPSGPPMPPPQLPYRDPLASPRTAAYSQAKIRWIMLAVFVIGMICLPVAIFLVGARHVSRSGLSTMFPIPSISSPSPAPSGSAPSATTAPAGGSLSVSGINEIRTVECKDSKITVSGVDNEVVITGHCASVNISGVHNKVTVEASETIRASGFNNDITYRSGTPHIETSGQENVVRRG